MRHAVRRSSFCSSPPACRVRSFLRPASSWPGAAPTRARTHRRHVIRDSRAEVERVATADVASRCCGPTRRGRSCTCERNCWLRGRRVRQLALSVACSRCCAAAGVPGRHRGAPCDPHDASALRTFIRACVCACACVCWSEGVTLGVQPGRPRGGTPQGGTCSRLWRRGYDKPGGYI